MSTISKTSIINCDIKYVHGTSIYVTDKHGTIAAQLYSLKYDESTRTFSIEVLYQRRSSDTIKKFTFNKYNIKNLGSWIVRPSIELLTQNAKEDKKKVSLQFFWPNDMKEFIGNLNCYNEKIQNELDIVLQYDSGMRDRLSEFENLRSEGSVDMSKTANTSHMSRMDSLPEVDELGLGSGNKRKKKGQKRKKTISKRKYKHKTRVKRKK
mgnify:FL=1